MDKTATIYHGSRFIIEKPEYGAGNPSNDYGLGFYCTHEPELAKEWTCTNEYGGFSNQYELELSDLSVMHLSGPDYNILNWLAVLLNNRKFRISSDIAAEGKAYLLEKFLPDITQYDIIIGYRADDSYFSFAKAFLNNTLSLAQLKKTMLLGQLGEQTVLISKKAFTCIRYINSEQVDNAEYYPKRDARDIAARAAFRLEIGRQRAADSVYLVDILRGGWENDDPRLR